LTKHAFPAFVEQLNTVSGPKLGKRHMFSAFENEKYFFLRFRPRRDQCKKERGEPPPLSDPAPNTRQGLARLPQSHRSRLHLCNGSFQFLDCSLGSFLSVLGQEVLQAVD
jgi:hypothetical protein